jgi:hypothetical protein
MRASQPMARNLPERTFFISIAASPKDLEPGRFDHDTKYYEAELMSTVVNLAFIFKGSRI